jgi:putative acetyltransferase
MTIRPETARDYDAIRQIHIAAFANHPYSHQTEHLIVDALRAAGALSDSLVADIEGDVVGHIAFSPAKLDGKDSAWFVLGPVGVRPALQRQGIGKELVKQGLAVLRSLGAQGCVLVGDPAYYFRFGFAHHPTLVLDGVPPKYFLCLSMTNSVPHATVAHHAAFSVSA